MSLGAGTRVLFVVTATAATIAAMALCWWLGVAPQPLPVQTARANGTAADVAAPIEVERADTPDAPPPVLRDVVTPAAMPQPQTASRPGAGPALRGRVLLDTREPAAGAAVHLGSLAARTGVDGAFVLEGAPLGGSLVVISRGHEPLVIDDVAPLIEAGRGGPVELVLGGPALGIDGWLMSADGALGAGWQLELHGGTPCGHRGFPEPCAEDLAAGASEAPEAPTASARALLAQHARRLQPTQHANLQAIGADGAFRIGGLRRGRSYLLRAWNERTLQVAFSPPILAGTTRYWFVVPRPVLREIHGRVVGGNGAPLAAVRVRLTMRVHQANGTTSYQTGQEARTGADGAFAFADVPQQDLLLRFDAADVESTARDVRAADPATDLVVRMTRRWSFRYEPMPGTSRAEALRVLDAGGSPLRASLEAEGRAEIGMQFAIGERASLDITVGETASWLQLIRDGREVRRLPIRFADGVATVVRG